MATAKIIKLTDNNNKTLLPITDSAYVQHRWSEGANGTTVTSTRDAINKIGNDIVFLSANSHTSGSDNQHISYDTSTNKKGIMLDGNGGNIKLGTSGLITISYTSNVLTFGTTANNYVHPTNGAAGSQGPGYVTPANTANTTLTHSGKFVIPNFKVDVNGHITAAGTITYQLPDSGNTDTRRTVSSSTSKYWIDGTLSSLSLGSALTGITDGSSYIENGSLYSPTISSTNLYKNGATVATEEYVNSRISSAINFKGNWPTTAPTSINQYDAWRINTASTNWNSTGIKVEAGDIVLALSNNPGTTATNWTVIQNNIDTSSLVTSVKASSGNTALTASPTTASNGNVTVTFTHETSTAGTTAVTANSKNVTGTSGQQKVITGITVNNYGHVTGYTAANIYSTDTNNDRAFIVANPETQTILNATGNNNGMFINVWAREIANQINTVNKHSIKLVGTGRTTVKSSTAGTITIDTSAETLTHNIYAVVGNDADINETWLTSVLGSSTSSSYFETIS